MSDDNLKEILGFDPNSGERIEDRTGMQQVGKESKRIDPEIQSKFRAIFGESNENKKVFPNTLSVIEKTRLGHINRTRFLFSPTVTSRDNTAEFMPRMTLSIFPGHGGQ